VKAVQVISESDNVATALEPLEVGREVREGPAAVVVRDPIPRGHKLALRAIAEGESVVKYGSPIGVASQDIPAGAHVHTHNVSSTRGRGDLAPVSGRLAEPE
jgi:altronate dehydratase